MLINKNGCEFLTNGYTHEDIKKIEKRLQKVGIPCTHDSENSCDLCDFDVDKCKKVFEDFDKEKIELCEICRSQTSEQNSEA